LRVIGIDPGKSGGIALSGIVENAECWPMPETERDTWELLRDIENEHCLTDAVALIEKVHAMPGQGVTSMFNFGMNYGMLRAFLVASEMPFEAVTPVKWQRYFGLLKKPGETNTSKKNRHKALAQELFPTLTVTHKVADALLLARYGCLRQSGVVAP